MKSHIPTITVMLDDRRAKENGLYPVKLRVTIKGERKYYPLDQDCSKAVWETVLKPKGGGERVKELRNLKTSHEAKAFEIVKELKLFTFNLFESKYLNEALSKNHKDAITDDVYSSIKIYANNLINEGRISSGQSYESLLSSVKRFHMSKKLIFSQITVDFLKNYEKWMLECGRTNGSPQRYAGIGIYMRNLRYIVGQAVSNKLINADDYPFGKNKYQPPVGANIKKALNIEQLKAIQAYPLPEGEIIERSRDLYIFTYLCNGMNLKDICLLKWGDIEGDAFHFIRSKTSKTVKQQKFIRVTLNDITKSIIAKWSSSVKGKDEYVFPFLKKNLNPTQVRYAVGTLCKRINSDMRTISENLGIEINTTTYTARHSYASQMLRNNAPIKLIEDGLGHTTLAFTEHYLAELDEVTQREFSSKLL